MTDLKFPVDNYTHETKTVADRTISYRAWRGQPYCAAPKDGIQTLNVFVPDCYFNGTGHPLYTLKTAPIMMPSTVGGYMPGPAGEPGTDMEGKPNFIFAALDHGYVVATPGVRGRSTGRRSNDFFVGGVPNQTNSEDGPLVGKAPALIVDMKAAIRYLRHNRDIIPGDTERIFTDGTSAGGALSALAGATGNHPDYADSLREIGACDERDDIFGAVCFCPIHNLENADTAYEWQFRDIRRYHFMKFSVDEKGGIHLDPLEADMSDEQMAYSEELATAFPAYVNSLKLRDGSGTPLALNGDGTGSFRDYIVKELIRSAQREVGVTETTVKRLGWRTGCYTPVEELNYLTITNGTVTELRWDEYIQAITRMKATPAFDQLDLCSPENDEFGTAEEPAKHFTGFGAEHSKAGGTLADTGIIKRLNPIRYMPRQRNFN